MISYRTYIIISDSNKHKELQIKRCENENKKYNYLMENESIWQETRVQHCSQIVGIVFQMYSHCVIFPSKTFKISQISVGKESINVKNIEQPDNFHSLILFIKMQ